ncbi:MAG: YdiU family protein [Gammaproteobacteria bacterium]|nr:MAG: YdiU family protein [Gammaproteobacteria bacterium]
MAGFGSISLQNTYRQLGEQFYSDQLPTKVLDPTLIRLNHTLASQLNLPVGVLETEKAIQILAGNSVPDDICPIATVYAGHQFGGWNPQLGDGRAILLGEVIGEDDKRYDIQLKGAGRTPYSRMGDGRSPLGPVLREYIVSEAMAALGIPTTRALAAVTTGETVVREMAQPGAVLTRVAQSHIRIGTIQYFSARNDLTSVKILADYVIDRHYREAVAQIVAKTGDGPYAALLTCVAEAQASLIAQWMAVGFIHGVMNTDNMLLCGETVDYGPCAFMDGYNPEKVFSSIDTQGRYAYANQAEIGLWNVSWLAQALLPLIDECEDEAIKVAEKILANYSLIFKQTYQQLLAEKLGFPGSNAEVDQLSLELQQIMAAEVSDYTLTYRALADCLAPEPDRPFLNKIYSFPDAFQAWRQRWQALLAEQGVDLAIAHALMLSKNPSYIPRNHLIAEAIEQASQHQDFGLFNQLVDVLARPFEYREENKVFALSPKPEEEVKQTFCGT